MRLLSLLALVALACATSRIPDPRWLDQLTRNDFQVSDTEFVANREYKFVYNGQLAIGIPGSSSQHASTRIQALVSLVFKTKTEVYLNMLEVRMGKLNDHMPNPRDILPFESFEHIQIEDRLKQKLMAPIKFHYKHGMITEVVFDRVEQPWSANIKRGILNMLQVNLNKQRRTDMSDDALISRSVAEIQNQQNEMPGVDFYSVMENTIEGECETFYTITSQPSRRPRVNRPVLNVTKSINFEKCNRRPEIKYNYRFQDWCPTCEARYNTQERVLRSSTIAKYNMTVSESKEDFLLESVIVESHYTYAPFNEEDQVINTYVNQTLVLIKTSHIESPLREIHDPIPSDSHLIFTPDWDIAKERFFMDGESEFQSQHSYPELGNKVEFVKNILVKLAHYMNEKVDEEAPRHFTRLVKVMRMLKPEELERVHQQYFKEQPTEFTPEEHKRIKSLLPDAVALCGTRVCVDHLVEKIKEHDVRGFKAIVAIKKLNDIRVVSEHMIEKLWSLTEHEVCNRNPILRQSVYLTIGTLINALCAENEDKLAVEFKIKTEKLCPRALKERFTQRLFSQLRSSVNTYEKVLLLKTIGNAGIDLSIFELEKIIKNVDKIYSRIERVEAILALRQLKDIMPRKVQKILMPIYMNRLELPTVRMTAFHYLMQTLPEKPILDQITRSLFVEKNIQVASFVFTKLHTLANSTNPCEKKVADDLKLSLRHSRFLPVSSWITHSKFLRLQAQSLKQKVGFTMDFVNIKSNESVLPNVIAANFHTNIGSMWNKYLGQISFTQFGLDHFLRRLLREQSHNLQSTVEKMYNTKYNRDSSEQQDQDSQEQLQERVNPKFNYRQELRTLFSSLSIQERDMYEGEPFGALNLKFKDQDWGFLPFVKEIIPEEYLEMITKEETSLSSLFNKVKRFLSDDFSLPIDITTATFIHEQSRKIPTTIGIPVQIGVKVPTIFQLTGMVKLEMDKTDYLNKIKLVFTHMRPSFVSTLVTKVESWTPIVNSGVKVIAQTKMFMPIDGSILVDTKKSPMEIKFTWEPIKALNNGKVDFITIQSRPITTTLVWPRHLTEWKEPEERTIHETEWNRVKEHNIIFGEQALGLKVHSRGQWHRDPIHSTWCSCLPGGQCFCLPKFLPLAGPNKWTITVEKGHDTPKEVVLTISGKLFETMDKLKMRPQFDNFFTENNEEYLEKSEMTEEYKKFETFGSNKHFINVILETKGSGVRRHVQANTDCFCSDDMRSCKCKLAVDRSPIPSLESEPWKFNAEVETLFPQTAYSISELTSDKKLMTRLKATWGPINNMDKFVDIKIVGDRSESMKTMLDQSIYKRIYDVEEQRNQYKSQFSPVSQFAKVIKYGKLNEYKIDIDYKVTPIVKNITNKIYRLIKHAYYWQTEINDFKHESSVESQQYYSPEIRMTPENKIRARFTIDPVNLRFMNISINTPREVAIIRDIPLWTAFEPLNLRRPSTPTYFPKSRNSIYNMFTKVFSSETTRPTCEIRSDTITTFDKVEMNLPMTTCYTVLAKDCESETKPKFAIMIKKESENEELKTMKIVTKSQKLVLIGKTDEEMEITLNGQIKTIEDIEEVMEHGHVVLRCTKSGPYIKCELPDVHVNVFFDGFSANVKVSSIYRNMVCGLCGDNDGEQEDEITGSDNTPFRTVPEMYRSYLVRDSECTIDQQQLDQTLNQPSRYERRQYAWEQDDDQDIHDRYSTYRQNQHKSQPIRSRQQQQQRENSGEYSSEKVVDRERDDSSSSEESSEYSSRRQQKGDNWETSPVKATKMIEQNHQVCFSQIPVPKCPRGTYTRQYKEQPLKVPYVCLTRSELQTETYIRLAARNQQIPEIAQLKQDFTEMEIVPRSCRKN